MRRALAYFLAAVLLVGVGFAVYWGGFRGKTGGPAALGAAPKRVYGVIGSEKKSFFEDPAVVKRLKDAGYEVVVDTAGSREIATQDLSKYAFAFPASTPAAEKIKRDHAGSGPTFAPFFSPMAIATWEPIVGLLKANKLARDEDGHPVLDMAAYLEAVKSGKRWTELPGNSVYPANKPILIASTDLRRSNSAAMYMAVTSYVANGNRVLSAPDQVDAVQQVVAKTFLDQGYVENSSAGPFGTYLSMGMGQIPMVFAYEQQFVEHQLLNDGMVREPMRLMYPSPAVFSQHTVVALNEDGAKIGALLSDDPELAKLAAAHGFRPRNPAVFSDRLKAAGLAEPPALVNVIDPPSFEMSEQLISRVEKLYSPSQLVSPNE